MGPYSIQEYGLFDALTYLFFWYLVIWCMYRDHSYMTDTDHYFKLIKT